MRTRLLAAVCCAAWLAAAPLTASAAGRYDPRLHFRSIRTAHFTIHYHQGEETQARRLARLAEEIRADLQARLELRAPGHTHVILVDQTDSANGWSTPLPYNLLEITLTPPAPGSFLGNHDDWLRLVFTHEYTHTMHMDQVEGWMRGFRTVLGRHPMSFPNLFAPTWQVEGFATYAESTRGLGRVHGADVREVMRAQAASGRLPHLDQLAGGVAAWPSGLAPYFYGGAFYDYLARTGGETSLGALSRETAGRVPYFGAGAFHTVYGKNVAALWASFAQELSAAARSPRPASPGIRRLTRSGYVSSGPRFAPDPPASASSMPDVFYSSATAHGFPALRRIGGDGSKDRRVQTRYLGNTVGFWRGWIVYDQLEYDGPVALFSDLWASEPRTGRTIRLTRGARLGDPDVSRDGSTLAGVLSRAGERSLVLYPITPSPEGQPRVAAVPLASVSVPGCSIATPRWSPDGRHIAAVVQCTGSRPDILLYAVQPRTWSRVAPDERARDFAPTWTPDGGWILFVSDRGGAGTGIYAVPAADPSAAPVKVVESPGGASSPDVSPDGTSVVFLSTTADGLDVFVAPVPRLPAAAESRTGSAPAAVSSWTAPVDPAPDTGAFPPDRPYSPWSTLLPRFWQPLVTIDGDRADVGAAVSGADALGRHAYQVIATWPVSRPETSPGLPASTRPDWYASYTYDRWRPALFVDASNETDTLTVTSGGEAAPVTAQSRTREVFAGLIVPVRRVRANHAFLFGVSLFEQRTPLAETTLTRERHALRSAWAFSTAREYGYSISREHGVRASATIEQVMPALGADGQATTTTGDLRAYLPGGVRHAVLALRAAAGVSQGDTSVRRVFANGGHGAWVSGLSFDRRAVALLRGFEDSTFRGTAVVAASADYRVPLLTVERGAGTYPLFVNQFHGAVFFDMATGGETLSTLGDARWSAGGELAAKITVGYGLTLNLTAGAAWTHDPGRDTRPGRAAAFVRTGYAF